MLANNRLSFNNKDDPEGEQQQVEGDYNEATGMMYAQDQLDDNMNQLSPEGADGHEFEPQHQNENMYD